MRRVLLPIVLLCVGVLLSAAQHKPSGSFALDQVDPKPGDSISFTVNVQNLPNNGGATIAPWVELSCGTVYDALDAAATPVNQGTTNPTRVFFTLTSDAWAQAGFTTQECEAYLFYDGYNGPRRRKTNTLAALFFTATAPE